MSRAKPQTIFLPTNYVELIADGWEVSKQVVRLYMKEQKLKIWDHDCARLAREAMNHVCPQSIWSAAIKYHGVRTRQQLMRCFRNDPLLNLRVNSRQFNVQLN